MNTSKSYIRNRYRQLRKQLSAEEIENFSMAIANNVLLLHIWTHRYFHLFLPIVRHNEVNTEYILHILAGKDKETIISKSDFTTREMDHFLLTDATKISVNDYGIPEPVDGILISPEKIDVVFVPLLAYDKAGNRIGYGKGFYDRFLAKCRPETVKIGISFFEPEDSCGEILDSDIRLDYCVTPSKIYKF